MLVINIPNTNVSITIDKPLFNAKELLIAEHTLNTIGVEAVANSVKCHLNGEWGDVTPTEKLTNQQAVKGGGNIISAHKTDEGVRFIIVTDTDTGETTVLII